MQRAPTTNLNNLEFLPIVYNCEEDFEKFTEQCQEESKKNKKEFKEKHPVDPQARGNYEVCYDGEEPYDAYMIKVDISMGYYSGNTFYKMQILREKVRDFYILFTKWGRVGESGQYQQTPFSTIEDARKEYCSLFKSKTGNLWEDRAKFEKVKKKYRLIPFAPKTRHENFLKAFNYKDPRMPATQLEKSIFKLIRRLCNYKVINNAIFSNYHINEDILPFQNITKERILDAQAIVNTISKVLESYQKSREKRELDEVTAAAEELTQLTSEFYELLPTTQYREEAIPPITSEYTVGNLKKMIDDLLYFEVVIKLLWAATYNISKVNPVDYCFNCLSFKVAAIDPRGDEFQVIKDFVKIGRQGQSIKNLIANIYSIERRNERENIKKWDSKGNRMLLWHGTKGENIVGILQTGFRIAPSDSSRTGSMFGEGVYFADIFNKSYQYAGASNMGYNHRKVSKREGFYNQKKKSMKRYMFLCEVALGKMKVLTNAEQVTGLPNKDLQSVMGYGRIGPAPEGNIFLPNGSIIPLGHLKNNPEPKLTTKNSYWGLNHNEFVVYDTTQIRVRYMLELRSDF